MSYSFRDRPRLSDRLRGKSGDEIFKELRQELDQDRFFDNLSSNWGSSAGSRFPRAGHLFEDPLMRHTDIRSHLEDLAQRHPEFADQLRYPAWGNENTSNTFGRKRRGSGSGQSDTGEASKQQPTDSARPETTEEPLRGRAKDNLRNTVPDMGQKQQEAEDKESRGQRSWSAPPDNRTQPMEKPRFVSKIEIHPVNPDAPQTQPTGDATKPPMAPPKPQPQPQQQQPQPQPHGRQSTVRHIPIFVEGRDEPVLPKNIEPEFTQTQAPPPPQFSRPPPQTHYTSPPNNFQQQAPPRKLSTPPQFEQQTQPPPQHKPDPTPPQPEPEQPAAPAVNPRDPLYRVECVQKEVDELKEKVEKFNGSTRSDKEYILLDEMLTRNLIKLDDIETEGKDEVRAARKNTIRSIQRCISVLENKVPLPGSEKSDQAMEVERQSGDATETPEDKPMELERQPSQQDVPSADGSGETPVSSAEEPENNAA